MPPLSIMVKPVSGLCNMRCTYCFYCDEMRMREQGAYGKMSPETLETLMRRIFIYADGAVSLAFQGGEPTLAGPDFYRLLLDLEKKYNTRRIPVHHALQTNGFELSDELIAVLKEGKFLLGVSMDGTQAIHDSRRIDASHRGTYDRILENTRRLTAAGVDFNILCVVDRQIAVHAGEVFDALKGFEYLQFIPRLDPIDGSKDADSLTAEDFGLFLSETWQRYARMLRRGQHISVRAFDNWLAMLAGYPPENCGFAGRCSVNYLVESNGNLYPCDFYALDEWLLGNIHTTSFQRLSKSPVQRAFVERSLAADDGCRACPYAFICRGGCRRDREPPNTDGPLLKNRLCDGYRYFFGRHLNDMQLLTRQLFKYNSAKQ